MRLTQRPLLLPRIARLPVVRDRISGPRPALQFPDPRRRFAAGTFPARRNLEGDRERRNAVCFADSAGQNIENTGAFGGSCGLCGRQGETLNPCANIFSYRRAGYSIILTPSVSPHHAYFGRNVRLRHRQGRTPFTWKYPIAPSSGGRSGAPTSGAVRPRI